MMFSDRLKSAIAQVSAEIASDALDSFDCEAAGCSEEVLLAECTIDARRLEMFGHVQEQREMERLVAEHGYPAVLDEAARHVQY